LTVSLEGPHNAAIHSEGKAIVQVNAVGGCAGRGRGRTSTLLALFVTTVLVIAGYTAAVNAPAALADTTPDLSIAALQSVPVQQLRGLAQQQWDLAVANGSVGQFAAGADDGGDQLKEIENKNVRDALNKAVEVSVKNNVGGIAGKFVSTGKTMTWMDTVAAGLASDTNDLQLAATGTGWVKILGPVMGIAASASVGDPQGIAANAVTLTAQLLGLGIDLITGGPEGTLIGLIAVLIDAFIYASKITDMSPTSSDKLLGYRDGKFAGLLPDFATDYFTTVSAGFARLQTRTLYELGLADAAVESAAKSAAQQDPSSGNLAWTKALQTERSMHDQTLADLSTASTNFTAAAKTAFTDLITTSSTDNGEVTAFTNAVFPMYHPNMDVDSTAPLAWDNGPGMDTVGWHYFAAEADYLQSTADVGSNCTYDAANNHRTSVDYSNLGLQYLWDNCQVVINQMNEVFLPRVVTLQTTPITIPDGTLQTALDNAMALPAVTANFTAVTAIPLVSQPWAITSPAPSSSGVGRTDLITGTGSAGQSVQVRSGAHPESVVCSANVDDYGYWACAPENPVDAGTTTTYDLYDGQGSPLNVSETETFA
jgi:hypothetical protein